MKNLSILFLLLSFFGAQSQNKTTEQKYRNPLDIPMYMSGCFGELRSNHFHAGIDIKTQGTTGFKVFAIADGWVSRIKVSPWGYGKSIYINHPDGTTSVYAHLDRFASPIDKYTLNYQYKTKRFSVNKYLKPSEIKIKKGDLIAYSGNTGGSAGPHLHFEMRESKSQSPINPMQFHFDIKDEISPQIKFLVLFLGDSIRYIPTKKEGQNYLIENTLILKQGTRLGFVSEDYSDGSQNPLGLTEVKLMSRNEMIYQYSNQKFSFAESRYINALIDYPEKEKNKISIHKLYIEPGNRLSLYNRQLKWPNTQAYQTIPMQLTVNDAVGNESKLNFFIEWSKEVLEKPNIDQRAQLLPYNKSKQLKISPFCSVSIPKGALYKDDYIISDTLHSEIAFEQIAYALKSSGAAFHKRAKIKIKPRNAIKLPIRQYVISRWENNERQECLNTSFSESSFTAPFRNLGTFLIEIDSLAPQINFLKKTKTALYFTVTDNLSGLKDYAAYIDQHWVLLEYDAKKDQLIYRFDPFTKALNKNRTIIIKVSDSAGNRSSFQYEFFY